MKLRKTFQFVKGEKLICQSMLEDCMHESPVGIGMYYILDDENRK